MPTAKAAIEKQIDAWHKTAERYESDREAGNGRKQLAERAKEAEEERDLALAHYHHYELASAAFQIGIVLASAAVITGMAGARLGGRRALGASAFRPARARAVRPACGAVHRDFVGVVRHCERAAA